MKSEMKSADEKFNHNGMNRKEEEEEKLLLLLFTF